MSEVIKYPERLAQIADFGGLKYGKIMPTDIDGLFELKDKVFVIFELKYRNTRLSTGQRIAFERLCDNLSKPTMLIVAEHQVDDCAEPIYADKCAVRTYREDRSWHKPHHEGQTVKELFEHFIKKHNIEL